MLDMHTLSYSQSYELLTYSLTIYEGSDHLYSALVERAYPSYISTAGTLWVQSPCMRPALIKGHMVSKI